MVPRQVGLALSILVCIVACACSYDTIRSTDKSDASTHDDDGGASDSGELGSVDGGTSDSGSIRVVDGGSHEDAGDSDSGALDDGLLHVVPRYATSPLWNDFASAANPEVTCDAEIEPRLPGNCVHAGVMRKVVFKDRKTCTGLSARDDALWFTWSCVVQDGHATFVTGDLKAGVTLESLIDRTGKEPKWRENFVTIKDARDVTLDTTKSEAFWTNPLRKIAKTNAVTSIVMNVPSAVYVVTGTPIARLSIESPNITLLVPEAIRVGPFEGSATPFISTTPGLPFLRIEHADFAPSYVLDGIVLDLVYGVLRDIDLSRGQWGGDGTDLSIKGEGTIVDGVLSLFGATGMLIQGKHLKVDNLHIGNVGTQCLRVTNCSDSVFDNVEIGPGHQGLNIEDSSDLKFSDVRVARIFNDADANMHTSDGMNVDGVEGSTFRDVYVSSCENDGVRVAASDLTSAVSENNLFMNVSSASNGGAGLMLGGRNNRALMVTATGNDGDGVRSEGSHNVLQHITSLQNRGSGINLFAANDTLVNALSSNNFTGVFVGTPAAGSVIQDVFATNNEAGRDLFVSKDDCVLLGQLRVTNANSCSATSGLTKPFPSAPSCTTTAPSDAIAESPYTINGDLVGKLGNKDPANLETVDGLGSIEYREDLDWLHFSNPYRHWGVYGVPDTSQSRGRCFQSTDVTPVPDVCAVWDARPAGTSVLANVLGFPPWPEAKNERYLRSHAWLAISEIKCNEIPGATWSGSVCSSQLVSYAFEPIDDGLGNDNGLCEIDETCTLVSNRGSYPGSGALDQVSSSESDHRVKFDGAGGKISLYSYASSTP